MTNSFEQAQIAMYKEELKKSKALITELYREINTLKQSKKPTKQTAALLKPRTMTLEEVREARIMRMVQSAGMVC